MSIDFWTTDRVNTLADLYAAKRSFGEIADDMGITRNSAIGKSKRMRDAGDARFPSRAPENGHKRPRVRDHAAEPREPKVRIRPPRPPRDLRLYIVRPTEREVEVDLSTPAVGKRLWDLGARECHFLIGRADYCAKPCHRNSPYCSAHHVLVYVPTKRAA